MGTGACGIDCDVCRLYIDGRCSTCGSGVSDDGGKKALVQEHLLGSTCPVLACARLNRIEFCMRDCESFPCQNFEAGAYPYSKAFLHMQQRRRNKSGLLHEPPGDTDRVPNAFWDELKRRDPVALCRVSGAWMDDNGRLAIRFLNEDLWVDVDARRLFRRKDEKWEKTADPLLALIVLVYLLNVSEAAICAEMVGVNDLKEAHFFQGPHTLNIEPLIVKFGHDPQAFKKAGRFLEGNELAMADAAFCLKPFFKIPVYYLLWVGDEEFPPRLSILFDRSIEFHLPADAIWGLVSLLTDRLIKV